MFAGRDVRRAVEHQVLAQVGRTAAAGRIVGGPRPVPEVNGHDRYAAVRADRDPQAVVQSPLDERKVTGSFAELTPAHTATA